jgi:Porin-like glycoporin RafY
MRKVLGPIAVATLTVLALPAHADFNANIEFDNAYLNQDRGLSQSGRVELNAFGKVGPKYFVAAKASFLAKRDGSAGTDDMWVQFGSSAFDVKLGRFEAADLFPLPRDAIVLFANSDGQSNVYRANALRGRFGNASNGQGYFHGAVNFALGGGLGIELGVIETKADDTKGIRPVLNFSSGPLTLRVGAEALKWGVTGRSETGIGFTGAYELGAFKPILSLSATKDASGNKQQTFGVILDSTIGLTVGYIHGVTDLAAGDYKTDTVYAAYTMPLFDIKGASVTFAGSASQGGGSNVSPDDKGLKVRFNYAF